MGTSVALQADGVNGVAMSKGGLLKTPAGSGLVPQAARPGTMGWAESPTTPASQLLAVVPCVASSFITSAVGLGSAGGTSLSKSPHTESDARPFGVTKQLQQATSRSSGVKP